MIADGTVHHWAPAVHLTLKDLRELRNRALCVGKPLSAMVISLEIRHRESLDRWAQGEAIHAAASLSDGRIR